MSVFITIEGMGGAGKSTQMRLLLDYLTQQGFPCLSTREPGGTPLGERIREVLLDPAFAPMSVITQGLLFAAGRAEHCKAVIMPALQARKVVISSRYVDANMVYQGVAGGLPMDFLSLINEMATGSLKPHRTILLDLPPEVARLRKKAGATDEVSSQEIWFDQQVREGYLELARLEPRRVKVVDAFKSVEAVQDEVRRLVDEILPRRTRDM